MSAQPPLPVDDALGDLLAATLGAQYRLIRVLGRGGMGAVYLAHEPFLDRSVAVKVLPGDVASADARDRFLREARTAAKLSHPNIVPLYTFGQAGDLLYYLMGYVEGESLEARLRRDTRLPFDEARRITSEIADALEYAHQQGVVHRDVKPDNVLLDRRTGRAMLTDFGIAKQSLSRETRTATGIVIGTPHYMSPEQASGDGEIDGRTDIYSLGVMTYRMIAGRLPFEGQRLQDVLAQHVTRMPVPIAQAVIDVPLDLSTAVMRALEKDRADRWPTAQQMRETLQAGGEENMPDELRDILRSGVRMMIVALALVEVAVALTIFNWNGKWFGAGVVTAASAVIPSLSWLDARKPMRRYGRPAALRAWFLQPTWWNSWWPRFGRAEGDVWDRLPTPVKRMRKLSGIMVLSLAVFVNVVVAISRGYAETTTLTTALLELLCVWAAYAAPMLYQVVRYRRWGRLQGMSLRDARQLTTEWTGPGTFWRRPHIAALLNDSTPSANSHLGRAPADIVREIVGAARDGRALPHADLVADAAAGAQAIAAAIDACETEMAQLARDADPKEHARIVASLDALGSAASNESRSKTQVRELLDTQLQSYAQLERRREEVASRRDQLVEQLRALALQIAQLRARTALDSVDGVEITARVRELLREIDYRMAGVRETTNLLERD